MKNLTHIISGVLILVVGTLATALQPAKAGENDDAKLRIYRDAIEADRNVKSHVFRKTKERDLKMLVTYPDDWKADDRRPAIVFFFGGGWKSRDLLQFKEQAAYFASRGMVAMRADYRVGDRENVTPDKCVEDAKSAIRWVRKNAEKLGIDPDRIVASGGSAGGHLAACTGTTPGLEAEREDLSVSSRPNAMVLYNPALGLNRHLRERLGGSDELLKQVAPVLYVNKETPPALLLYCSNDFLLPEGEEFIAKSKTAGNRVELFLAEGMKHGFFNYPYWLEKTTYRADEFLATLGYVDGKPTVTLLDEADAPEIGPKSRWHLVRQEMRALARKTPGSTGGNRDTSLADNSKEESRRAARLPAGQRPRGGQPPRAGSGARRGPGFEQVTGRFDANKDGKVTLEEFGERKDMLKRFDNNGDGVVTAADFKEQPAAGKAPEKPATPQGNAATGQQRRARPTLHRPGKPPENIEVRKDVVYGKGGKTDLKLDLYLPRDKAVSGRSAMVFVHGGGWRKQDKSDFTAHSQDLASKGFVCISINYRLSGEAPFPAAVEDCKCAVRWLRAHAKEFNVDPNHIASCGGSAGGHLVAMLGTVEKSAGLEGTGGHAEFSSKVNAVIVGFGPTDFTESRPGAGPISEFMGGTLKELPELYKQASPIHHVDAADPPFLFMCGSNDTWMLSQCKAMMKKLKSAGVEAEIDIPEGAGHGFFRTGQWYQYSVDHFEEFLTKHFQPKRPGTKKAASVSKRGPRQRKRRNLFQLSDLPTDVELRRDVVYGKGGQQELKLDLFLPKAAPSPRPAIVFIHGGGGRKNELHAHAAAFASKGYVGACLDYRPSGPAGFRASVGDCKCAVRWLRAHATEFGIDPDRIAACGGSAGGQRAAMLGTTEKSDDWEGEGGWSEQSSKVNLVIAFNGAFDFTTPKLQRIFLGRNYTPEALAEGSPIKYVDASSPPFLLLHGTNDRAIPYAQSPAMQKKLQSAGVTAELFTAEGADHGFHRTKEWYARSVERMEKFLEKHFQVSKQ